MPRELFVLFAVAQATSDAGAAPPGVGALGVPAEVFGRLLALQAFVSLVTYLPVGWLAVRTGEPKPYVGLTFVFFSAFPICFALLGAKLGVAGLVAAYVVAGLRELGEPARKAIITELVPRDARTASIGVYWSVRCLAVAPAPIVGAILWLSAGPTAPFVVASALGTVGALLFVLRFRAAPIVSPSGP
jgi:MFS family permease